MKKCTKCDVEKPTEDFASDVSKRDGFYPSCKQCYREYYARIRAKKLEYKKAYREKNRARISEYRVKHYANNREKQVQDANDWAKKNPIKRRANESKRRAQKAGSSGSYTQQDISDIYRLQRRKCAICKANIAKEFHVDHVIPLALRGDNTRCNIQLLCVPCNLSKRATHPVDFMQKRGNLL